MGTVFPFQTSVSGSRLSELNHDDSDSTTGYLHYAEEASVSYTASDNDIVISFPIHVRRGETVRIELTRRSSDSAATPSPIINRQNDAHEFEGGDTMDEGAVIMRNRYLGQQAKVEALLMFILTGVALVYLGWALSTTWLPIVLTLPGELILLSVPGILFLRRRHRRGR